MIKKKYSKFFGKWFVKNFRSSITTSITLVVHTSHLKTISFFPNFARHLYLWMTIKALKNVGIASALDRLVCTLSMSAVYTVKVPLGNALNLSMSETLYWLRRSSNHKNSTWNVSWKFVVMCKSLVHLWILH